MERVGGGNEGERVVRVLKLGVGREVSRRQRRGTSVEHTINAHIFARDRL